MSYQVGEIEALLGINMAPFDRALSKATSDWRRFADLLDLDRVADNVGSAAGRLADKVRDAADDVGDSFGDMGDKADQEGGRIERAVGGINQRIQSFAADFASSAKERIIEAILSIGGAIQGLVQGTAQTSFALNQAFESFGMQFETLLGSTGAAQTRMAELAEFGRQTPFELPGIVEASRILEVFTDGALATGEGLRLTGDIAAGTNTEFERVAFWVGRMYAAIQAGQPFGEAAMELQQMGAMSASLRSEMERLSEEGADAGEIWSRFTEETGGKFGGMMDRMSESVSGMLSNLADSRDQILLTLGRDAFGVIQEFLGEVLERLEEHGPEIQEWAERIGRDVARIAEVLAEAALEDVDWAGVADNIETIVDALADLLERMQANREMADSLSKGFINLTTALNPLVWAYRALVAVTREWSDESEKFVRKGEDVERAFGKMERAASSAWDHMAGPSATESILPDPDDLRDQQEGIVRAYEDFQQDTASLYDDLRQEEEDYKQNVQEIQGDIAAAHEDARQRVIKIEQEAAEQITEAQNDLLQAEREAAEERTELANDLTSQLQDIEKDAARDRAEIAEESAEARVEYEREAAEAIREFQRSQEQDARDHAERIEDLERSHRRRLRDIDRDIADILADVPQDAIPEGYTAEDLLTVEGKQRLAELRRARQDEIEEFGERRSELEEEAAEEQRIAREKHEAALAEHNRRYEAEERERQEALREIDRQAGEEVQAARDKHTEALRELEKRLQAERVATQRRQQEIARESQEDILRVRTAEQQKVRELEARLAQEEIRHGAAQAAIRFQIGQTETAYTTAVQNMKKSQEELNTELEETYNRAWAAYVMMSTLTGKSWDIDMQVNDYFKGRSPSPFERNLAGMLNLLNELDSLSVQPMIHTPSIPLAGMGAAAGGAGGGDINITIPGPFTGPITIANRGDAEELVNVIAGGLQGTLGRVLSESNRFPLGRVRRYNS